MKKHLFGAAACLAVLLTACGHNAAEKSEPVGTTGEAVDLGLSVKWGDHNVGATMPEESGNHYAWGEVKGKSFYDWNTYSYGDDYDKLTKYCNDTTFAKNGQPDNKIALDLDDDVARTLWGGTWRMPTKAEAQELIDSCAWNLVRKNGVMGYLIVGKNSNSIFLPAAGYRSNDGFGSVGVYGYYWTNTLFESNPSVAYELIFNTYSVQIIGDYRFDGRTIRPVCD